MTAWIRSAISATLLLVQSEWRGCKKVPHSVSHVDSLGIGRLPVSGFPNTHSSHCEAHSAPPLHPSASTLYTTSTDPGRQHSSTSLSEMAAKIAPKAISAISRPSTIAPALRNARGHAAAVEPPAPGPGVARAYYRDGDVRTNWRRSEIQKIFDGPLMETIFRAVTHPHPLSRAQLIDRLPYTGCTTTRLVYRCARS